MFSYCQTCDTQCTIDNAARRRPQVEGTLFKILLFLETRGASPFRFGSPFLKHSHQKGCLCHANCLMATVADGIGVDGVWCMGLGGGSGLWLESSSNSPSVSNVSFSQLREQAKNSSDQRAMERKKGGRVREQERRVKKHFIRWMPPHSVNILQIYIRHYLHFVRYSYRQ